MEEEKDKVVDTTTEQNEEFRTYAPLPEEWNAIGKREPVFGYDVYHWPEFKAFAARLGLHWDYGTTDINIFIPLDGSVRITQEYLGDALFHARRPRRALTFRELWNMVWSSKKDK